MFDVLPMALFWSAAILLWLGIPALLAVKAVDMSGLRAAAFMGLALFLLILPPAFLFLQPKQSTLLDAGCYHVGIDSTTTYVMSGKVLVPITTYHNTFVQFVCPS